MSEIFEALKAPFTPDAVEWRVAQAGKSNDRIWAKVLAYLTARAVMDRLDEVVGPANWKCEYTKAPHDPKGESVLCTLYLRIDGEWIGKSDGASASEIEGTKGGISDSLKRAAVCWGVGRYLYKLSEMFADCMTDRPPKTDDWHYAKLKEGGVYYWKDPELPKWALPIGKPSDDAKARAAKVAEETGALTALEMADVSSSIKALQECKTRGELMDQINKMKDFPAHVKDKIRPTVDRISKKYPAKEAA